MNVLQVIQKHPCQSFFRVGAYTERVTDMDISQDMRRTTNQSKQSTNHEPDNDEKNKHQRKASDNEIVNQSRRDR